MWPVFPFPSSFPGLACSPGLIWLLVFCAGASWPALSSSFLASPVLPLRLAGFGWWGRGMRFSPVRGEPCVMVCCGLCGGFLPRSVPKKKEHHPNRAAVKKHLKTTFPGPLLQGPYTTRTDTQATPNIVSASNMSSTTRCDPCVFSFVGDWSFTFAIDN